MVPRDLRPEDRVMFRNSRATRTITARVVRITFTHLITAEVKTGRVRAFRYDDPRAHIQRAPTS